MSAQGNLDLIEAARNGIEKTVAVLLERTDVDINFQDKNGYPALIYAASDGRVEVVRVMLQKGADVNIRIKTIGYTALIVASRNGHVEIVKLLLQARADVQVQAVWDMRTALMHAAEKGHTVIARLLLQAGADMDKQLKDKKTALDLAQAEELKNMFRQHKEFAKDGGHQGNLDLIAAANRGDLAAVTALLARSDVDKNYQDNVGLTPLMHAVTGGHLEVVKALLRARADLNAQDKDGRPALNYAKTEDMRSLLQQHKERTDNFGGQGNLDLMEAARYGNVDAVRALLERTDVDKHYVDKIGYTALTYAAIEGRCEVVRVLLQRGADVNMRTTNGWTALIIASDGGHVETVKLLLQAKADVHAHGTVDTRTALMKAVERGHLEVMMLLLQAGSNVDQQHKDGSTALDRAKTEEIRNVLRQHKELTKDGRCQGNLDLLEAAKKGDVAAVTALLVRSDVDKNYQNEVGQTALMHAVIGGHVEVVKALLRSRADVNLRDKAGRPALSYAKTEDMRSLLQQHKERTDNYGGQGNLDLIAAARSGNIPVVTALLARTDVDINYIDQTGYTSLVYAAIDGRVEVARLLLQAGAGVNMGNTTNRWTALIVASMNGHLSVVKLLLQAKADVHVYGTSDGRTALMHAAVKGHAEIVKLLLQAGADLDKQLKDGKTALDVAQTEEIKNLFRQHKEFTKDGGQQGNLDLIAAANRGDWANVTALLARSDVDKNYQDQVGLTALMHAVIGGHVEVVKALLRARADVNLHDKNGRPALNYAKTEDMRSLLQQHKERTDNYGGQGNLDLIAAARSGNLPVVTALLARTDVDINYIDQTGYTSLVYAAIDGRVEVARLLLQAGAGVNMGNTTNRWTALIVASMNGHVSVVKLLLQAKADVHVCGTSDAKTALIHAAVKGHAEIVMLLLQAGADANYKMKDGKSALDLAKTEEIKNMLRQHQVLAPAKQPSTGAPVAAVPAVAPAVPSKSNPVGVVSPVVPPATPVQASPPAALPAATEFTEQDRVALQTLSQASTQSLLVHGRLNEVMLTVAAHDRTLQLLVSKQKECPSLFWFYPKKRELRNWLSNPAKCLFQDTLMMVVVCPVTLCVVQCGPQGVGWEITMPKEWVKKWGPAILFSIYVMQAAVVAGRVVGIPLPQLPSASNLTGLSSTVLGVGVNDVANQQNMMKCLTEFASTTASVLGQQNKEMQALCDNIQQQGRLGVAPVGDKKALAEDHVKQMTGDAYKSMHTFLTTGDNAKLGKLEDQLRGRMERVMAPNGDVDWVSVEGREMWLEQRKRIQLAPPASNQPLPSGWNAKLPASAALPAVVQAESPVEHSSWLAVHLQEAGVEAEHISHCHVILVKGEGYASEKVFVATSPDEFNTAYLKSVGISAKGLQNVLIAAHRKLHAQHSPTPSTPATPVSDKSAATFTSDEKATVLQMQSTIQDLTSQLSKLRASAAAPNSTSTTNGPRGGGGRGGLAQQQAQSTANAINPRTGLPYTMDDLSEEILRLQREVAQTNRDIGNVAAATKEGFEDINSNSAGAGNAGKKEDKRKTFWSMFGSK